MAKPINVCFPKLKARMALNAHTTSTLAKVLDIPVTGVRRRLSGNVEFDLSEIEKLINFYHCKFEDLFGKIATQ